MLDHNQVNRLEVFYHKMLKKISRRERLAQIEKNGFDRISNQELRDTMRRPEIKEILRDRRLRFLGHNLRHTEPLSRK